MALKDEVWLPQVDPIRQWQTIKLLSHGAWLGADLTRQKTPWKLMLRQSMVAAANFGQLESFQAVTVPLNQVDCSGLNSETIGELSRRMTVYMSQQEQDVLPIVIDSGASKSLTPNLQDFVGPIQPAEISSLNGLSGTTAVRGFGTVQWMVRDDMGVARTIKTKAYYVPEASICLFSPQTFFQEQQAGNWYSTTRKRSCKSRMGHG